MVMLQMWLLEADYVIFFLLGMYWLCCCSFVTKSYLWKVEHIFVGILLNTHTLTMHWHIGHITSFCITMLWTRHLFVLIYQCKILCCGNLSFITVDNDDLQVAVGSTVITLVIHSW